MSEEILNESTSGEVVSRDTTLPILDLTHLPPYEITEGDVSTAASEQGIDTSSEFEVRLPEPSSDGQLIIGSMAFQSKSVTKVYNLNKVAHIDMDAFRDTKLSGKIWIDRCTSFSTGAFNGCSNITEVVLSPNLETITDGCFSDCSSLTKVHNLNKVTSICRNAFKGTSLSGKIWIDRCTSLDESAFGNCSDITEVVLNPNGCTLGDTCFIACGSLRKVYNLNKVTSIGSEAFTGSSLSGKLWLDRCTDIGMGVFYYCSSITEVVLNPNGCTLRSSCFNCCDYLKKVYNLNKVTNIGEAVFIGTSLSGKIWIDRCTNIGTMAFMSLSGITDIVLTQELYNSISGSLPNYAPESVNWIPV